MRVVFDTDVFVSALVFPGGVASRTLERIVDGRDELVVSKPIIDETVGILGRKFGRDDEALAGTALLIADLAEIVAPAFTLSVLVDEPDNRIIECAVSGRAGVIVTGDKAMLAIRSYHGIRLSALAEYVADG